MLEKMLPMLLNQLPKEFAFVAQITTGKEPEKIDGTHKAINLLGNILLNHMKRLSGLENPSVIVYKHLEVFYISAAVIDENKNVKLVATLTASDLAAEIVKSTPQKS